MMTWMKSMELPQKTSTMEKIKRITTQKMHPTSSRGHQVIWAGHWHRCVPHQHRVLGWSRKSWCFSLTLSLSLVHSALPFTISVRIKGPPPFYERVLQSCFICMNLTWYHIVFFILRITIINLAWTCTVLSYRPYPGQRSLKHDHAVSY